jgi:large repetitive protein
MNLFYQNLRRLLVIALMLLTGSAFSQLAVNSSATATQLVSQILGPGVTASNISLDCGANGSGIFTNGQTTNIGLDQGIILTSGLANDAIGPNVSGATSFTTGNGSDPQLANLVAFPLNDACALSFDFVANANTITVQYVFASEEYNEFVCSQFNDVFGFFVSGPNPMGGNYTFQDVAQIPGTTHPVSVNTINNGTPGESYQASGCTSLAYSSLFNSNISGTTIEYDGFTVVLTATVNIVPGESYSFKFAIADASDSALDSGVFIKGSSFSTFLCQAGTIAFGTASNGTTFCSYDLNKTISVQTIGLTGGDNYEFILTTSNGEILAINSTGFFNLDAYSIGSYSVTGISYSGEITGLEVGNYISDIEAVENEGCFELSNSVSASIIACLEIVCPEDITVSCSQSGNLNVTGSAELVGNPNGAFEVIYTDEVTEGCTSTIIRTWSVISVTGAPVPADLNCIQTIISIDNEAPYFNEEITDLHVQCPEDIPAFAECLAVDNCSDIIGNWSFETSNEAGEETCILTTAFGPGVDWSIWLANLPGASDYYNFINGGTMQVYGDGSALITGTVAASNNANQQFFVFIRLENKRNWTDWSALGRDYKDDALLAGNNFLDWDYYELDGENSFLVGAGDFAGSILNLTHMPANFFYGFQCGLAANNKNANLGLSGWFFYDGWFNGANVSGAGDVNVDKECEPNQQVSECEYIVSRYWYALDACGNLGSAQQNITVADTEAPVFTVTPENLFLACIDEVPAPDASQLQAIDNCADSVTITYEGDFQTGDDCNAIITRTYEAIDSCGNFVKHFQVITVIDNVAPVLSGVPSDLALNCNQVIPAAAVVAATDNCDDSVVVNYNESTIFGQCPQSYVIQRTWSAVDSCGNDVSATQYITVSDTQAPVITECPADASYDCLADVPAANIALVSANDNCGDVTIVLYSENTDGDDCEGTIVRTYRAYDECGNYADCVHVINYNDNVAPIFDNAPANMVASCDNVPAVADVTASDNCGDATVTVVETLFSGGCVGVIQRIFIATDECGNTATHEQYITLVDTIAPVLHNLPADATYECSDKMPFVPNVTATDNCDSSVIVNFSETTQEGECPNEYTIFRTWSAVDTCENEVSYTQIINVVDTTSPTFNVQNNEITVACDFVVNVVTPVATDNCDTTPTVTVASSSTPGECANEWTEMYTWTATDDCGNSSSVSLTINYVDEVAPEIIMPEVNEMNAYCGYFQGDDAQSYLNGLMTPEDSTAFVAYVQSLFASQGLTPIGVTDNCDLNPYWEEVSIEILTDVECPVLYEIRCNFQAFDQCGNASGISTSYLYIIDDVAPVIACPADASYSCLADVPAANTALVSATDVCSDVTIVLHSEVATGNDCQGTIVRTYRATDACGNFSNCVQVINYNDNVAPTFDNAPANMVASCDNVPAVADVTASDNCGDATVTVVETLFSGGCVGVIQRIFTATDECGNTAVHEQYITLVDTIAPVLANLPANATYECNVGAPAPANVTATDNCDSSVIVVFNETQEAGDCPQEYTIFRTWSAVDTCENAVSYTQVITITDNTAPTFSFESWEETVDCATPIFFDAPVATDNCDSTPTVTVASSMTPGDCPNEWTEQISWTATDDCGNSSTVSITINYVDETAPVFTSVPENLFFDCIDDVPAADTTEVTATDLCGDVTISILSDTQEGDDCNAVISRTYRATDECGNFVDHVQTIVVLDNIAPVWDAIAEDFTASCDDVPAPVDCYATDNCSGIAAGFNETIVEGCPTIITRTWTATDECGNTATQTQIITVVDEVAPVITACPADASYVCLADVPAADVSLVSAVDVCNEVTIILHSEITDGNECEGVIIRTYRAYDACENYSECVQVITYNDNVAPTFDNAPANMVASCDNVPAVADVTASDNCGDATVTVVETLFSGGCVGVIQRIFTATDECGNTVTHEQYITLVDTIAPVMANLPADVEMECSDKMPFVPNVTATDNCDNGVNIDFNETIEESDCANNYTIVRTWTATDTCGNSVSHTQHIYVSDNTAPVLSGQDDELTIDCNVAIQLITPTATDNCDVDVNVELNVQTITGNCPNEWTEVYTWTAMDNCGNSAVRVITINYVDDNGPVFTDVADDLFFACISDIPAPNTILFAAEDNCGDVIITYQGDEQTGGDCDAVIYRTYRATDACGNYNDYTQVIVVEDSIAPWFNQDVIATIDAECSAVPAPAVLTATDNCSAAGVIYSEVEESGECDGEYTLIRTWIATDACGNSASLVQTVNVYDNTAPVFVDAPADATYTCDDEIPALEDCIAVDNCSSNITYTSVEYIEGYTGEDGLRQCTLTTPFNVLGQPWAVWLPNSIGEPQYYYLSAEGGQFVELPNGRAHLTGTVYATNNPNKRWIIDVYFKDRADWTTWSGLGRSYKDDALVAGNLYQNWDYYIMNADSAVLVGDGLYAGANLALTHMPASYYFGFQVGEAANNRNAADGMSGWFFYSGTWNNSAVTGIGDFGFEKECPECDYTITRIWTATDECGNEATAVQVITVQPADTDLEGGITEQQIGRTNGVTLAAWPNPTAHKSTINFNVPFGGQVMLEVFNMDGKLIETLYRGEVMAGQDYYLPFNAESLSNGIYLYKLTTPKGSQIDKLMIVK